MNTPAHAMINLMLLGRKERPRGQGAVVLGAILPDIPMVGFYFVQKVMRGEREEKIWRELYYMPEWQNLFDSFNSLPFMAVGLALCVIKKLKWGILFFGSMMLHVLGDFFLHHHDAHRHFFPLWDWRFYSPVSYWDPKFHGMTVSILEILAVIGCTFLLFCLAKFNASRWIIGLIGFSYLVYVGYVLIVWV